MEKAYLKFVEAYPRVKRWLKDRPVGTQERYGNALMHFCEDMNVEPAEFQDLDKKAARDLVWKYIEPFKSKTSAKASMHIAALKSFYRYKDGEVLPFDSRKGGKHYISRRRKKAKYEVVPSKEQAYAIIDATSNLRDRAMFFMAFQSGVRVNVLQHLKFGHVKNQLYPAMQVPLRLKITEDLDTKLRSYELVYYYTFLQGEAVQALKQYCDSFHRYNSEDALLFPSSSGRRSGKVTIWRIFKRAARRAGLDPKTMWVHSLRKAFRKVVRASPIDPDFAEVLMGHVLPGSRENYFDRHDIEELAEEYMKINFAREIPENNHARMRSEIEQLQSQNLGLVGIVEELRKELAAMKSELKALKG